MSLEQDFKELCEKHGVVPVLYGSDWAGGRLSFRKDGEEVLALEDNDPYHPVGIWSEPRKPKKLKPLPTLQELRSQRQDILDEIEQVEKEIAEEEERQKNPFNLPEISAYEGPDAFIDSLISFQEAVVSALKEIHDRLDK